MLCAWNQPFLLLTKTCHPARRDSTLFCEEVQEKPAAYLAFLRMGLGICSGLADMHAQGIAHMDIKGDNVLLKGGSTLCSSSSQPATWQCTPKIADFGLAASFDRATGRVNMPLFDFR